MSSFEMKKLYGGAIEAMMLTRLNSLGDTLPIPDVQEVFSDPNNKCSYIIELLERTQMQDIDALNLIFNDIIDANQATQQEILNQQQIGENKYRIEGTMTVNQAKIKLYLLVIRLVQNNTDVTFYIADPENQDSNSIREILQAFADSFKVIDYSLFS